MWSAGSGPDGSRKLNARPHSRMAGGTLGLGKKEMWKRFGRWPRFAMSVLKVLDRLAPHVLRDFRVLARKADPEG